MNDTQWVSCVRNLTQISGRYILVLLLYQSKIAFNPIAYQTKGCCWYAKFSQGPNTVRLHHNQAGYEL